MKIDRNNYEQYFLDYLDGQMNPEQEKILLSFLEFNPDLKEEIEGLERAHLLPSEKIFIKKDKLLKTADSFEKLCIDYVEGQLGHSEEREFLVSVSEDASKQVILNTFRLTRLLPDMSIKYPGKTHLRKLTLRGYGLRILITTAAAAAMIFGAVFIFNQDGDLPTLPELTGIDNEEQIPISIQETSSVEEELRVIQLSQATRKLPVISINYNPTPVESPREQIRISRIQSLGISNVLAVSSIPSYALMHKMSQDPGPLEQLALDQVDSGILAARTLPDRARDALWKMADAGVRGINQIIEDEVEFDREIDEEGKTRGFKFETAIFGISTPLQNTGIPQ
jgi:hypothetical protein